MIETLILLFITFILPFILALKGLKWYIAGAISFLAHMLYMSTINVNGLLYYAMPIFGGVGGPGHPTYFNLLFTLIFIFSSAFIGNWLRRKS